MTFWRALPSAVYGPDLYGDVPDSPPSEAFAFYAVWSCILGLILALLSIPLAVQGWRATGQYLTQFADAYPSGLVVSLHDGHVSSNQPQPNFIPLPVGASNAVYQNLAVVDTSTPYSEQQFRAYRTVFWVGQDAIFVADARDQSRIIDLSKLQTVDVTVSKASMQHWAQLMSGWSIFTFIAVPLLAFMAVNAWQVWNLAWLFVVALGIWAIASLQKMSWSYWHSYRAGLYAITLPVVLHFVFIWRGIHTFPFFYALVALAIFALSSLAANKRPPRVPGATEQPTVPDSTGGALG